MNINLNSVEKIAETDTTVTYKFEAAVSLEEAGRWKTCKCSGQFFLVTAPRPLGRGFLR